MDLDQPPVVRVSADRGRLSPGQWPMTVPAVAQLVREGFDLAPGVTFLVGENGSGKSTIVEAVAMAFGLSPEGGSTHSRHSTRAGESPLHTALTLQRGVGGGRGVLRAGRDAGGGGQVLGATHSPVLAALPGATLLEVGDWGYRTTSWERLELVQHWRAYLEAPGRYLRHLLDG